MKKILSVLLGLGLAGAAFGQFQPSPVINPLTATQEVYIDGNFHSVPFVLTTPNSGVTTLIFDPSTSLTDQNHVFQHMSKALGNTQTNAQPLVTAVMPAVVTTATRIQSTRVVVPFVVTSSTTLQTIPFSVASYVETGGHYRFECNLYLNAGGGGSKIDVGGTSSTTNFVAEYQSYTTTTLLYGGQLTAYLTAPSGSSTTGQTFVQIVGEVDVGNGGTFVIQFAQNGSSGTPSTVLAGSNLTVTQIP